MTQPSRDKKKTYNAEEQAQALLATRDALIEEFSSLMADAEDLLKRTSEQAGDGTEGLRRSLNESISNARKLLKDTGSTLQEQGRAATEATESYIHQNPFKALGIAAGVGFIIGLLVCRR